MGRLTRRAAATGAALLWRAPTHLSLPVIKVRAVKRARHNSYRVKKPGEPASIRHRAPATINIHELTPGSAA